MMKLEDLATAAPSIDEAEVDTLELGGVSFKVSKVAVADTRRRMPSMIRAAGRGGVAYLIVNARSPAAETALLINPALLDRTILAGKSSRTLKEVIDSMPFKRIGSPLIDAAIPDDFAPDLALPVANTSANGR